MFLIYLHLCFHYTRDEIQSEMSATNNRPVILTAREVRYSETFIQAHIEHLDAIVVNLNAYGRIEMPEKGFLLWAPVKRYLIRKKRQKLHALIVEANGPVLVEYGTTAARALSVLRGLPARIVIHFHGYDAHVHDVTERYRDAYRELFGLAEKLVVVSGVMRDALIGLGADPSKVVQNVYGIDVDQFPLSEPAANPPVFFACGRFVQKKAPIHTIRAFYLAWKRDPAIRLRFAGEGELLPACRQLVHELQLDQCVEFLGVLDHDAIASEFQRCRAFLQHSRVADNGDMEGTPLSILEAGSSGVPVIATRHAGIPEVVIHGETGLLCDEHDIDTMAEHIYSIATKPDLARMLGAKAREHICLYYNLRDSIGRLRDLLYADVPPDINRKGDV